MKFAGFDGVIVEGAAEEKVYLYIDEKGGELRDASKFWGLDTHETELAIKKEIGEKNTSVAAIGPAGENLCFGALIENDLHASFSHSGVGTIMGSKKLKAIAIKAKEDAKVDVADNERLKAIAKAWREALKTSEVTTFLGKAGIPRDEYKGVKEFLEVLTAKNLNQKQKGGFKMSKGYRGKIMRVDLTQKKVWDEPLPNEEVLRQYVGCYPLGLWYLEQMVRPGTHPLDPKNPLIFLTGPLTGTAVPSATKPSPAIMPPKVRFFCVFTSWSRTFSRPCWRTAMSKSSLSFRLRC
jgi:aldehyde:ferredoxin oxidoreductase